MQLATPTQTRAPPRLGEAEGENKHVHSLQTAANASRWWLRWAAISATERNHPLNRWAQGIYHLILPARPGDHTHGPQSERLGCQLHQLLRRIDIAVARGIQTISVTLMLIQRQFFRGRLKIKKAKECCFNSRVMC